MATPAPPTATRRRAASERGPDAAAAAAAAATYTEVGAAEAGAGEPAGPAIDTVLGELERVVAELEAGDLPLEIALRRFEDGVRLARQGGQLLDAVEQRVEMLLEGREGTAPFPGAGQDDEEEEEEDDQL